MDTVEDVLESLLRPPSQHAPSWRVRISFRNGVELEEMCAPDATWPMPLVTNPPARFIARQSMNLAISHLRNGDMEPVLLEIEPPQGTVDDYGRTVRTMIALIRVRGA